MAHHSHFRTQGPAESRSRKAFMPMVALAMAGSLAGCATYEPAPVDSSEILAQLRATSWDTPVPHPAEAEIRGATSAQLAAFAVTHNPSLKVVRSGIGVAEALLLQAGLLSDPGIGWDGMDVLASQIVEGSSSAVDFLSGIGVSLTLPRPGELDAKEGVARWRLEEARRQVIEVEWRLASAVYIACEDVREAELLIAQNQELLRVAESTRDYFDRSQAAGAATAIQANLATGDLLAIQAERVRLEARSRSVRHRLNALLGLPPTSDFPLAAILEETPEDLLASTPSALIEQALSLRPDLAVLDASYQSAEEEVRLEVKRQFPLLSIGTGIFLQAGFFSRFNGPAINTAIARRETLRQQFEAEVHEIRRDIEDAHAALGEAGRLLAFLESKLLPNAELSLKLAGEAFEAGEVSFLEILTLQRALVDARTCTTEAHSEFQRKAWRLRAAAGILLTNTAPQAISADQPQEEQS